MKNTTLLKMREFVNPDESVTEISRDQLKTFYHSKTLEFSLSFVLIVKAKTQRKLYSSCSYAI